MRLPQTSFGAFSLVAILVFLAVGGLGAQDAPAPTGTGPGALKKSPRRSSGQENLRFLALEQFDRREKLTDVRGRALSEEQIREQRRTEYLSVLRFTKLISNLKGGDEKVRAWLKVRRLALDLLASLEEDQERSKELLQLVARSALDTHAPDQVFQYLSRLQSATELALTRQLRQIREVKRIGKSVNDRIRSIPPPKYFIADNGLKMILAGSGKKAFYICRAPVSHALFTSLGIDSDSGVSEGIALNVSYLEARRFCSILSASEGALFRVASLEEMARYRKEHPSSMPVWTRTPWRWPHYEETKVAERFAITFYTIQDPAGALGVGASFGELPFARYSTIGFHVVAGVKSGHRDRYRRMKAALE
ncbi:MAG: hypothetical protein KAI66_10010 [Lentisphaeria bacterium]|nr:hypothetical protein [Lentisphaeria bacterium]